MSRWVVVDDTDPDLTYIGPWFQDSGSLDNLGNYGPPHWNTLHGTNSNASFSYSFHGSIVRITGTNQWSNAAGVVNPSWQCSVDGIIVPSTTLNPATPENRLLYCEKDGLSDGPHLITVNATASNQTFWFDYIQYLPSPSASLDQASFFIEAGDSQFQYGSGWNAFFPGNWTGQTASTFSFDFNGTFLTWLGFYDNTLPTAATTATYAIDGNSPIAFTLNGASAVDTGVQYNQVFFHTHQLSPGSHNLHVVYQGNSQTAPLTLYEIFVQNNASSSSSLPSSTTSSSSTSNGTSSPHANTENHSSNLGPIIGGVIGGLALILFAILAILFFRRRSNRSQEETANVNPFVGPSTVLPLLTHHSSSLHSKAHTRDLSGYASNDNTNTTSPLSSHHSSLPTGMIQTDPASPRLRGGDEFVSRARQPQPPKTQASHLLSPVRNGLQPTRFVHDEDAGVRFTQDGDVVELLPPVYSC